MMFSKQAHADWSGRCLFTPICTVWSRDDEYLDQSSRYWQARIGHKEVWIGYGGIEFLLLFGHVVHARSGRRGSRPISTGQNGARTSTLRAGNISLGFWDFQYALQVLSEIWWRSQEVFVLCHFCFALAACEFRGVGQRCTHSSQFARLEVEQSLDA
jgi:hypothetical protein